MNEQNDKNETNERQSKEKKIVKKKKAPMNGEKKFYLFTAIGCAAVLLAIIIIAVAVTNSNEMGTEGKLNSSTSSTQPDPDTGKDSGEDEPVVNLPEGMILPMASGEVSNDYGLYHNQSVGSYYLHKGVDFAAAVGTEVLAVEDGVVESIYKDDLLLGTEITVKHEDGLRSVYRFVTEVDGLKVGAEVKKGDVIATVAEANGNEYKDGAHLHFEILANGACVDPATYLTLEEK